MTLTEFRKSYPQYDDMTDYDLTTKLHAKYYSDMPIESFYKQLDYSPKKVDDVTNIADTASQMGKDFIGGISRSWDTLKDSANEVYNEDTKAQSVIPSRPDNFKEFVKNDIKDEAPQSIAQQVWDGVKHIASLPSNAMQEALSQSPTKTIDKALGGAATSLDKTYEYASKNYLTPMLNSILGTSDNVLTQKVNPYLEERRRQSENYVKDSSVGEVGAMSTDPLNVLLAGEGGAISRALQGAGVGSLMASRDANINNQEIDPKQLAANSILMGALTGGHALLSKGKTSEITNGMTDQEKQVAQGLSDRFNRPSETVETITDRPDYKTMDELKTYISENDKGGQAQADFFEKQMDLWAKAENIRRAEEGRAPVTAEQIANDFILNYDKTKQDTINSNSTLADLQSNPRYQELMDIRRDIPSKDTQYSQTLSQPRGTDAYGNWYGASYDHNFNADFELTKADVKAIESGKATPEQIAKLRNDLGRLDNDPMYKQAPFDANEQFAANGELFSKAYHGTPHEVDRFSTDKIGTGEGAQAYGYGLYFADSKSVAEWYADKLGKDIAINSKSDLNNLLKKSPNSDISEVIKKIKKYVAHINNGIFGGSVNYHLKTHLQELEHYYENKIEYGINVDFYKQKKEELSNFYKNIKNTGNLYRVDLKPKEEEYLLWDKPLSEQPKALKAFRNSLPNDMLNAFDANVKNGVTGANAYKNWMWGTKNEAETSAKLHSLGIKGIKYFDGTSRGKGEGNYNYVIFNDKDVDITGANGKMFDGTPDELFQNKENIKGSYTIDQKLIKIFKDSDYSTINHELGHRFLFTLNAKERAIAEQVFGVKDGDWKVENHEAFADAYARYIADGKVQSEGVKAIFEKFKAFTKQLLLDLQANNGGKLPPMSKETKEFFKAMLGDEQARANLLEKMEGKEAKPLDGSRELFQIPQNLLSAQQSATIGHDVSTLKNVYEKAKEFTKEVVDSFKIQTPDYYGKMLDDRFTAIGKAQNDAETIHKALMQFSPETNKILQRSIVGDIKSLPQGYEVLQPIVDGVRAEIKRYTKQLVNLGMIDKDTALAYENTYLKRSYASHYSDEGKGNGSKTVPTMHTRGAQIESADVDSILVFVNKRLDAMGEKEIVNPMDITDIHDALQSRNLLDSSIAKGKFTWKETNGKVEVRTDWTKSERESMGEIENAAVTVPTTLLKMNLMLENAKLMREVSHTYGHFKSEEEAIANGYERIPDTQRYGELRGMYVEKSIADDLKYAFEMEDTIFKTYKQATALWKMGKTVFNPVSHVNNFLGNVSTQLMLGRTMKESIEMVKETTLQAKAFTTDIREYESLHVKDFSKTLTPEETARYNVLKNNLKYYIEGKENGLFGRGQITDILTKYNPLTNDFGGQGIVGETLKSINKAYQGGDDIPRLASYKVLRENGMDVKEAKEFVNSVFPDYSKQLPKGVRFLRDSGLSPFISWSYYVLPNIAKLAKAHPTRALGLLSSIYLASYVMSGINPFGDEIPDKEQGRRIPISKDGTTVKVDRLIPGFDIASLPIDAVTKLANGLYHGKGVGALNDAVNAAGRDTAKLAQSYLMGGLPSTAFGLVNNIDPYSGRSISGDDNNSAKGTYNTLKYILGSVSPALLTTFGGIAENQIAPKERKKHAEVESRTNMQEVLKLLGINTLTYNTNEVEKKRRQQDIKLLK